MSCTSALRRGYRSLVGVQAHSRAWCIWGCQAPRGTGSNGAVTYRQAAALEQTTPVWSAWRAYSDASSREGASRGTNAGPGDGVQVVGKEGRGAGGGPARYGGKARAAGSAVGEGMDGSHPAYEPKLDVPGFVREGVRNGDVMYAFRRLRRQMNDGGLTDLLAKKTREHVKPSEVRRRLKKKQERKIAAMTLRRYVKEMHLRYNISR